MFLCGRSLGVFLFGFFFSSSSSVIRLFVGMFYVVDDDIGTFHFAEVELKGASVEEHAVAGLGECTGNIPCRFNSTQLDKTRIVSHRFTCYLQRWEGKVSTATPAPPKNRTKGQRRFFAKAGQSKGKRIVLRVWRSFG